MTDLSAVHTHLATASLPRPVRAPRGTTLHCANWLI